MKKIHFHEIESELNLVVKIGNHITKEHFLSKKSAENVGWKYVKYVKISMQTFSDSTLRFVEIKRESGTIFKPYYVVEIFDKFLRHEV